MGEEDGWAVYLFDKRQPVSFHPFSFSCSYQGHRGTGAFPCEMQVHPAQVTDLTITHNDKQPFTLSPTDNLKITN